MTVLFTDIEDALTTLFTGFSTDVLGRGAGINVPVFLDKPDAELYKNRVYPCICIAFAGMKHEEAYEDSTNSEQVSVDEGTIPFVSTNRPSPTWYRVEYNINLWVARDAQASRNLLQWAILQKKPRDILRIANRDYELYTGQVFDNDEEEKDRTLYHNMFRVATVVDMIKPDTTTQVNQIHYLGFGFQGVKNRVVPINQGQQLHENAIRSPYQVAPVNSSSDSVPAVDAEVCFEENFYIDDSGYWIPPS